MKKQILTPRARLYCLVGTIWCGANFAFLLVNMLRNSGGMAFPAGVHDASGFYSIDHGRRHDFTAAEFRLCNWQGMATCVSIPAYLLGIFILHATGDIKQR